MKKHSSNFKAPEFVDSGPQWAKSSSGFMVAFIGRFELKYAEGDHILVAPVEPLVDRVLIELSKTRGWQPPHSSETIAPEKLEEIGSNIAAAMRHLRTGFSIE